MASEIVEQSMEYEGQPSIDSNDPNERKLARRLRIKGRLEAAEKLKAIAEGSYEEPEPEVPLIDDTIETCEDTLRQLFEEGKELVSNVMVASDAREVERRETELEERNKRFDKLREESGLALEKLDEISKKWETIMEASGPLELHQHMKEQKARCLDLIEQKNELIKGFQLELKLADEKFMKERRTMYEELSLLTRRIDEQVLLMKRAYRIELGHVEESVDTTRTQIIENHEKIWQNLYNQRERDETTNMDRKFNMVKSFHEELHKLHIDHEEQYRETRIQLETDIQILEQELEQVKALCLLNSEKLDYNYQVLKKREEENVYIKNHQKRRLNKLQDIVNTLKKKIDEKSQSVDEDHKKLAKEVERYHTNVLETDRKADHFSQVNDEKFTSIWNMKEEEAKELVNKILAADMVIYEQILGLSWTPPPTPLPNKTDLPSYKAALFAVKNQKKKVHKKLKQNSKDLQENETLPEVIAGHKRLLRHILELIADQSGFLMEEKLDQLLQPYADDEKTFVRLDNVFVAIGIRSEKDVKTMKKIFLPYASCLLCEKQNVSTASVDLQDSSETKHQDNSRQYSILQIRELEEKVSKLRIQAKEGVTESSNEYFPRRDPHDGSGDQDQALENVSFSKGESLANRLNNSGSIKKDSKPVLKESKDGTVGSEQGVHHYVSGCSIAHPLIIEKHQVLKALKDFVSFYYGERGHVMPGIGPVLHKKRFTVSRLLAKQDISAFWQKFKEVLPPKIENVWNATLIGLTKYLTLLQERHELNVKAKALRRQNMELRRLLTYYKVTTDNQFALPSLPSLPDGPIDPEQLAAIANKLSH